MITVQIASDLHIEYKNDSVPDPLDFITPSADILILAGDIGSFYKIEQLTQFLQKLCPLFQIVLYVPGNHEWYIAPGYDPIPWHVLAKRMYSLSHQIPNLHILDRSSVRVGDICIAGATLWSRPKCKVPPFIVRVHGMRTREYLYRHEGDLEYVEKMITYCQQREYKLVVVTHHAPTERVLIGAKKRKQFESLYATDLEHLLDKNKVQTWICGHIHKNFDFITEKGCRVVGNQKGKVKDNVPDYQCNFTIDI